uniref:HDC15595 n=1 Tax=Drosophila melanogaster TaxID=7227 RepID=Q6IJ96_DROME|nr:TPA_inf: HDC15595 [Drosophila melanogaster]
MFYSRFGRHLIMQNGTFHLQRLGGVCSHSGLSFDPPNGSRTMEIATVELFVARALFTSATCVSVSVPQLKTQKPGSIWGSNSGSRT